MQQLSRILATAALFVCVPAGVLMAQDTPNTGPATATTPVLTPAPTAPAPTAPAPAATAPAATAPAATVPASAATAPAPPATAPAPPAKAPDVTTTEHTTKKNKPRNMTRQQEIERSIDSGTVPARYRKSVPKEYQQYIPFAK
jgi:hypothetical protein